MGVEPPKYDANLLTEEGFQGIQHDTTILLRDTCGFTCAFIPICKNEMMIPISYSI